MSEREINSIFREAAYIAGDIVFCYDMITGKFMHYSDKSEMSKYGSWVSDFDSHMKQSGMVYPDDLELFENLVARMKKGDTGTMEGTLRMRTSSRGEHRWFHVMARTNFDKGEPVSVVGRAVDIHAFVLENEAKLKENVRDLSTEGVKDKDDFIDYIIRYSRTHKKKDFLTCVLFRIPAYDDLISRFSQEQAKEYLINLTRRIRRIFPHDTVVARIGAHRLGIFSGEVTGYAEAGQLVAKAINEIKRSGEPYGTELKVWTGVCAEANAKQSDGMSVYDKAQSALDKARTFQKEKVEFFAVDRRKNNMLKDIQEDENSEDVIVEFAFKLLSDSDEITDGGRDKIKYVIGRLIERLGKKYGVERISISICEDKEYEEFQHWESESISQLPSGMLLHINGPEDDVEATVNLWEPYVNNNVDAYPDDSAYGRILSFSAVKSVLQNGFECSNGYKCIVSLEYYSQAHFWTEEDRNVLDRMKYIADFCIKYIR